MLLHSFELINIEIKITEYSIVEIILSLNRTFLSMSNFDDCQACLVNLSLHPPSTKHVKTNEYTLYGPTDVVT